MGSALYSFSFLLPSTSSFQDFVLLSLDVLEYPNLCPLLVLVKHLHLRLSMTSDSFSFRLYFNLDFLAKGENFKNGGFFWSASKLWLHKQC